ncbi:ATP-dependent DNA helicase RecG [Candidatus Peregrinibacteria bacterium]|nr:ATP-dependent DNA helicase RecG [Candidatus Peregrinibacteria bacterium]
MELSTPLAAVLRTTKDFVAALEQMNIRTAGDLLLYLPRAYEDLSRMQTVATSAIGEKVTIRGVVDQTKIVRIRGGRQIVTARFTDRDGATAEAVWFNQPHIKRMITDGDEVVLTGRLALKGRKIQFQSPVFEKQTGRPLIHSGRLVPVYPQHDRINTRWLREKMALLKPAISHIRETLPAAVIKEENLMGRAAAIRALHFPDDPAAVGRATERLAFEKIYCLQRSALERKREWQAARQQRLCTPMNVELIRALFRSLKFTPTNSQKVAIYEILRDMEKDVPMSRLLEGDVGSGKTLVAVAVMANVLLHHGQTALMVPTEVLARQHSSGIARLLLNLHGYLQKDDVHIEAERHDSATPAADGSPLRAFPLPRLALLTGSTSKSEADAIRVGLASGTVDIVVGTHALIEDKIAFRDLRLVIVDEQHRFGVLQRKRLREKGSPHFLSMTATPIPRTLALTAYGDHDLSVLLEKPGRRQPIHTKVVSPDDRGTVERFIDNQIGEGRQVFVICPLIEAAGTSNEAYVPAEVKNVQAETKRLSDEFPRRKIAMLHGRLTSREKQAIMQSFRDRQSDILVSTSVIEVGIDVPNATIICIEGAERFGLAQLHQLRGRVGRGDHKSHCFLFTTSREQAHSLRLKAMEQHDSGFMLAEIDLKLRGPGELFGLRQSGIPDAESCQLIKPELIARARRAAEQELDMEVGDRIPG